MPYVDNATILQQNGQISTDEFLVKVRSEPGFLGRHYLLPSIQTNIARKAVLGAYLAANEFPAPAQTMEIILVPNAEARHGQGMYGKADTNYTTQINNGHKAGTISNIINNQPINLGEEVKQWDTIGNDKIVFKLNSQISVTKKFVLWTIQQSDMPQALQVAVNGIMNALSMTYEDVFLLELVAKGVNLNNEILNGDPSRPVCKFVLDPTQPVDVSFNPSTNAKNNAFVQLINNVGTYIAELGLDPVSELICAPIFVNNLKNSANWVFNAYQNTQQTTEMRTGVIGELLNGVRVFQAPRLSARYGNVLLSGVKCPDFFIIDRSRLLIPKIVVESLHIEPAPSTYFSTALIKALEIFGVYAQPVTIEDYQAQLAGNVRSAAISYGYLYTNPAAVTIGTGTATLSAPTYLAGRGLNTVLLTGGGITGPTNPKTNGVICGAKIVGTLVSTVSATDFTNPLSPDGIRTYLAGEGLLPSADTSPTWTSTISFGVISDFYQTSTIYVKFNIVYENSTVVTSNTVTCTRSADTNGFFVWKATAVS